jgi:hypothetical protein
VKFWKSPHSRLGKILIRLADLGLLGVHQGRIALADVESVSQSRIVVIIARVHRAEMRGIVSHESVYIVALLWLVSSTVKAKAE